jgi:hypothetical protein
VTERLPNIVLSSNRKSQDWVVKKQETLKTDFVPTVVRMTAETGKCFGKRGEIKNKSCYRVPVSECQNRTFGADPSRLKPAGRAAAPFHVLPPRQLKNPRYAPDETFWSSANAISIISLSFATGASDTRRPYRSRF